MDKDYITIKEYAHLKGFSTQYAYRLLKSKLKPFVVEVDGRKCLKSKVLRVDLATLPTNQETKKSVSKQVSKQVEKVDKVSTSSSINEEEYKRINKRNEDIIDELREQIKQKDAQIIELSNHIAEQSSKIAELFDNNQKLQLNYQLLLTDENTTKYDDENVQSASAEVIEDEQPQRKGFFSRFFK